jgi:hypothetical protein
MQEPGLDRHEWETEWQDLEERLADDPYDALFELDELVARMMEASGLPLAERAGESNPEADTVRQFQEARRIAQRLAGGDTVDPGDIGFAVNSYRELYDVLLNRRLSY